MPLTACIGLGSNLPSPAGSPHQTILAAMDALAALGIVTARSSLYETLPVGYQDQPPFVNAAAAVETNLDPESLLQSLLAIERRFGRVRAQSIPKGPRTLDLDLLLMSSAEGDGLVHESPTLTLPHPELATRRFVLAPLSQIAPTLVHPLLKKTIAELLIELPDLGPNCNSAVHVMPSGTI